MIGPLISRRKIFIVREVDSKMKVLRKHNENRRTLNRKKREQQECSVDLESQVGLQQSASTVPPCTSSHFEPKSTPVAESAFKQQQEISTLSSQRQIIHAQETENVERSTSTVYENQYYKTNSFSIEQQVRILQGSSQVPQPANQFTGCSLLAITSPNQVLFSFISHASPKTKTPQYFPSISPIANNIPSILF